MLKKDHEEGVWASCFIFMPSDLPTHLAFWFRLVLYTGRRIQALLFKVMGPPFPGRDTGGAVVYLILAMESGRNAWCMGPLGSVYILTEKSVN